MELRLDIGFNQLIGLIKQLPPDQKLKINKEVEKQILSTEKSLINNDLTELLLSGPVMTKDEESNFKKFNKEFSKWTKNLYA